MIGFQKTMPKSCTPNSSTLTMHTSPMQFNSSSLFVSRRHKTKQNKTNTIVSGRVAINRKQRLPRKHSVRPDLLRKVQGRRYVRKATEGRTNTKQRKGWIKVEEGNRMQKGRSGRAAGWASEGGVGDRKRISTYTGF